MAKNPQQISEIILGMRAAYANGANAMDWCREHVRLTHSGRCENDLIATLVAYDLQSGSYVSLARSNPEGNLQWCRQLAGLLSGVLLEGDSVLEVGVGEATTLAGVLEECAVKPSVALGFDVSWSRVSEGRKWLKEKGQEAYLYVADLLNIPLADKSVDVVYSSHSLEPNGGQEEVALRECLRVARKTVLLVEPIYELASTDAQERMRRHGYIEGLHETAHRLDAVITDYRLLDYTPNPLNPSGVLRLEKDGAPSSGADESQGIVFRCPITRAGLAAGKDFYYAADVGLAYPVLRGVPMLRAEHAIVASKLGFEDLSQSH